MTSAFQTKPRSNHKTDGQSQDVLQNIFEKFGQTPYLPLDKKVGNCMKERVVPDINFLWNYFEYSKFEYQIALADIIGIKS